MSTGILATAYALRCGGQVGLDGIESRQTVEGQEEGEKGQEDCQQHQPHHTPLLESGVVEGLWKLLMRTLRPARLFVLHHDTKGG